jgi:hypothetical protein
MVPRREGQKWDGNHHLTGMVDFPKLTFDEGFSLAGSEGRANKGR